MFLKTLGFFSSKILTMLLNGQSNKQPSGRPPLSEPPFGDQSNQNP
jgi:hypothetical protein